MRTVTVTVMVVAVAAGVMIMRCTAGWGAAVADACEQIISSLDFML